MQAQSRGTSLLRYAAAYRTRSATFTRSTIQCHPQTVRFASRMNRDIKPSLQERYKEYVRLAKKDYPIIFPLLLIGCIASTAVLGLVAWDRQRAYAELSIYPSEVEQHLRLALTSIHVLPNPDKAEYQFNRALQATQEADMDQFAPEVIGIRIRKAEMLEKFGRAEKAVDVLDNIVEKCQEKLEEIDSGRIDRHAPGTSKLRGLMLKTIIRSRVKLASLYESEYLRNQQKAKTVLSDAVGLLVKETQDPQTQGFSEDNAAELPLEEIASMLSQMGDLYATTGEEANAVQVYMLTLAPLRQACNGSRSCREVQVMSNIASAMALAMKKPGANINGRPATKQSLAAARHSTLKWADQAIATADKISAEERDEICQFGVISAELTKADLFLEDGKTIQARNAYNVLLPKLKELGLKDLVATAQKGLERAGG